MIYCGVCNKKINDCKCKRPFTIETKIDDKLEIKEVKKEDKKLKKE